MISGASLGRIPDTTIAHYPSATQPPAPHTRAELNRMLELLHAFTADTIAIGHGRHSASVAAANAIAIAWGQSAGTVLDTVSWPADAASWLRPACSPCPWFNLGGDSHLDRIHAERRTRWAVSRGPRRRHLTGAVLPMPGKAPAVPEDAEDHLALVRWFPQQCDGDGAALTVNHKPSRALLTAACHRFGWLILGKQAPPEHQPPEAFHLRSIVEQLAGNRRRGRRLLLTTKGRELLQADTPTLWSAVTSTLIPTDPAQAAAAEVMLMQLLTGDPTPYGSPIGAETLTGEGWKIDGGPVTTDDAGWLTGGLFGRLHFLRLTGKSGLTHRAPLAPAGRAAAIAALRDRAYAPRDRP